MIEHVMRLTTAQARPIVAKTFPNYKGRKFQIEFTDKVHFGDTNWDGGSKSTYKAVSADGKVAAMPDYAPWDSRNWEGRSVELPTDVLVVEHSFFCGMDMGIRIYAHPSHLPKWLPAGR